VPDEVRRPAPIGAGDTAVDLIDELAVFAQGLPRWCGADGLPLSWRHFHYGLSYLGRAYLREQAQVAGAVRMARGDEERFRDWAADVALFTGPGVLAEGER
jgi:hypothetical protein